MTDQQDVDVPGQRDWTLDPGRVIDGRTLAQVLHRMTEPAPESAPDPGVLARLDVPSPIEDWHALCDTWGVPRNPDALVRAVQAAAYDRATTAYLADQRAREEA